MSNNINNHQFFMSDVFLQQHSIPLLSIAIHQNLFTFCKIIAHPQQYSYLKQQTHIKRQIKKAVRFKRNSFNPSKTRTIERRLPKKRYLRRSFNYYQALIKNRIPNACHVLNFYNILTMNDTAVRHPEHNESFIKTHFYYKNMKRIEAAENYFSFTCLSGVELTSFRPDFIAKYKNDSDPCFQRMGRLLEDIQKRLVMQRPVSEDQQSNLRKEGEQLLSILDTGAYICKIGSDRLVVSRSFMEIFAYDTEEFIIECMKFRVPLFEQGFAFEAYYYIVMKNLENVLLLMDLLAGRIPFESFREMAYYQFMERLFSKRNKQYRCRMSLSMPVPLIALVKVEEVLEQREKLEYEGAMGSYKDFKAYIKKVKDKEFATLQHLTTLPANSLPQNKPKVADQLPLSDGDNPKSSLTVAVQPFTPLDHSQPF